VYFFEGYSSAYMCMCTYVCTYVCIVRIEGYSSAYIYMCSCPLFDFEYESDKFVFSLFWKITKKTISLTAYLSLYRMKLRSFHKYLFF